MNWQAFKLFRPVRMRDDIGGRRDNLVAGETCWAVIRPNERELTAVVPECVDAKPGDVLAVPHDKD